MLPGLISGLLLWKRLRATCYARTQSPAAANGNIPIMLTIIKMTVICFHGTNTRTKTKEKFKKNECDVKYNVVRSSQKLK